MGVSLSPLSQNVSTKFDAEKLSQILFKGMQRAVEKHYWIWEDK